MQGRALGSALSPSWLSRATCGHVGLFVIPRGFLPPCLGSGGSLFLEYLCLHFHLCIYISDPFSEPVPMSLSSKSPFFSPPIAVNLFHCTAKARRVHLINTLVTHSVAAQLLVSKPGAPPAGEIFQGSAVILLSPGLGTAVPPPPPPQSQCRPSKGAFSLQSL